MADTVARALEIAREGNCRTISDIRRRLSREGHENVDAHLAGATIRRQLRVIIDGAGR